jgi:hypothetical protein
VSDLGVLHRGPKRGDFGDNAIKGRNKGGAVGFAEAEFDGTTECSTGARKDPLAVREAAPCAV